MIYGLYCILCMHTHTHIYTQVPSIQSQHSGCRGKQFSHLVLIYTQRRESCRVLGRMKFEVSTLSECSKSHREMLESWISPECLMGLELLVRLLTLKYLHPWIHFQNRIQSWHYRVASRMPSFKETTDQRGHSISSSLGLFSSESMHRRQQVYQHFRYTGLSRYHTQK